MPQITHIITGLNVGGAERALHTLLTNGLEGPFSNRVISLMGEGHYGPLLRAAGIPVTCLHMRRGLPTPSSIIQLRRALRQAPPDILQGWMYHGNLVSFLAGWLSPNRPRIAWNVRLSLDAPELLAGNTRRINAMAARLSRRMDAVVFNSQRSRVQHVHLGYYAENAIVVPNGFDLSRWQNFDVGRAREQLNLDDNVLAIGFVGRGHPQKDIPNLARAFATVYARNPSAVLLGVGRDLEPLVPSDVSRDGMRFLGQRDDIEKLLPGFDLFCLPSRAEGFPNVIGEAMACGVPCVTTDVGDAADVVGDTGWIVPPGDPTALAQALCEGLNVGAKDRQRRGLAARRRIEENYALPTIVARYRDLYEHLERNS